MPSNKNRLYIALYARGGAPSMSGLEDAYHWAFIVGPKSETSISRGSRFHAKEVIRVVGNPPVAQSVWEYEEQDTAMAPTLMLLARVLIAKVKSLSRLRSIFERTPLRPELQNWNCVEWIRDALEAAMTDGKAIVTNASDWQSVRDTAMWYVEAKKTAHRFDGIVRYDQKKAATWDMLEGVELTP